MALRHWRELARRHPDGSALALLFAVVAVAQADLLRGRILFERDVSGLYWGLQASFRRCVLSGSWPLWNPWAGFGQPMLANLSTQVLYPTTWLSLLLPPEIQYSVYVILHFLVAAAGVYALGRTFGLSRSASTAAAAVFVLSGPMLSYESLWHHFAGASLMPWVLVTAERHARRPGVLAALGWGATQALQVVAGSVDAVLMTLALEALVLGAHVRWRRPLDPENRRIAATAALAVACTLGLTAVLWLPALQVVGESTRASLSEGTRNIWALRPLHFVQWFFPLLPQDLPLARSVREWLYDGRDPLVGSLYLGLAALPLALAALLGERRRAALALTLVLAGSAALSLGHHGPFLPALTGVLPVLRVFRYPSKVAIVGALAFAFLAGLGLEAWRRRSRGEDRRWRLLVALPTLALCAASLALLLAVRAHAESWLSEPPPPGQLPAVFVPVVGSVALGTLAGALALGGTRPALGAFLVLALAATDLLQAHVGLNPTARVGVFARTPLVVSFLRADGATRVDTVDYKLRPAGAPPVVLRDPAAIASLPRKWRFALINQEYPTSLARYGMRSAFETDPFSLEIPQVRSLYLLLVDARRRPADHLRLLQLGAVSHVLAREAGAGAGLVPATTIVTPQAGVVHVFQVPQTRPLVYLAGGVRVADGPAAYRILLDPAFDPRREIVLPAGPERSVPAGFHGEARIVDERPDRLRLAANLDQPGYLVVVDGYEPGWRAWVDGRPEAVLRADAAFRAVPLRAGSHVVELAYRPTSVALGLVLSLAALASTVGAGVTLRRRKAAGSP